MVGGLVVAGFAMPVVDVSGSWYEWRSVRVRAEVALVCDRMAEDAESVARGTPGLEAGLFSPGRSRCYEPGSGLVAATGGLGLDRWRAALRRRRFRTIEDAKLKAKALRARPAVEAALAELDSIVSDRDAEVAAAASRLGQCSERVISYGRLGAVVTGMPIAELARPRPTSLLTGPVRRYRHRCAHVRGRCQRPTGR